MHEDAFPQVQAALTGQGRLYRTFTTTVLQVLVMSSKLSRMPKWTSLFSWRGKRNLCTLQYACFSICL